jgi:anti-anti-sigma factor
VDDEAGDGGQPGLTIFSEHRHGLVCVLLGGELDLTTAPGLRREVVEVDASARTGIDSAGLTVLDEARRAVRQAGGRFRLVAGAPLRRLVVLSGLSDLLVDR